MALVLNGSNNTIAGLAAGGLPDDSVVLADLSASGTASSSTFLRGDNAWAAPALGDSNTPQFWAYSSTNQEFSSNTATLLTCAEVIDTGGMYASDRFTPTVAGKYFVHFQASIATGESTDFELYLRKNATNDHILYLSNRVTTSGNRVLITGSKIVSLNGSGDYLELKGYHWAHSGSNRNWSMKGFGGFRIGDV
tara:strand:- start:138 stop:719 length:582 start_codon:yes stop_codon:yes gene_type:complete